MPAQWWCWRSPTGDADLPFCSSGSIATPPASSFGSCPPGNLARGKAAPAAGRRELLEETGYTARRWKRALRFYPSPGFLDETMTVYLARGLKPGRARPEADEAITTRFFSLSTAVRMARNGTTRDGKTLAALFWFAGVNARGRR